MEFLQWLNDLPLASWIRDSDLGYPSVVSAHAIGMAIVVGFVVMYDLRILGFGRSISFAWFSRLYPLAWIGVAINVISGVLLYITEPEKFTFNTSFQIKIALIIAGAIAFWLLGRAVARQPGRGVSAAAATPAMRNIAWWSMVFWIGAIIAGRLVAYVDQ